MKVKIYVEGGGDNRNQQKKCREGFRRFFCKAGLKGKMPSIVACGGRSNAFRDFEIAIKKAKAGEFVVLLVDSEEAVNSVSNPWKHLKERKGDGWKKPEKADDESVHLMVQCMEAWFLADR